MPLLRPRRCRESDIKGATAYSPGFLFCPQNPQRLYVRFVVLPIGCTVFPRICQPAIFKARDRPSGNCLACSKGTGNRWATVIPSSDRTFGCVYSLLRDLRQE